MDNRPIGVLDSGLGGLTSVQELHRQLPEEKVIYYGDTARTASAPALACSCSQSWALPAK